jgi:tRNA threonylcarbamoyladenosine biosynthesis protein TsaB
VTRILALDTSTWWGSIALVSGEQSHDEVEVAAELGARVRDSHADRLLHRIDLLLAEAGWPKSSLDLYAATRGPGSFTGIRVGLGTIRGLSLATGRPCAGVTTLEALAEAHGPADRERMPVMDAGRGEFYGARFDPASTPPRTIDEPWLGNAARALGPSGPVVMIPGPGTRIDPARLPAGAAVARATRNVAAAVGRLVLLRGTVERGEGVLAPLYLRPPDALVKKRKKTSS